MVFYIPMFSLYSHRREVSTLLMCKLSMCTCVCVCDKEITIRLFPLPVKCLYDGRCQGNMVVVTRVAWWLAPGWNGGCYQVDLLHDGRYQGGMVPFWLLPGWNCSLLECFPAGRYQGGMAPWWNGSMVEWLHGGMVLWSALPGWNGSMVEWFFGGPYQGGMVPWWNGSMLVVTSVE